MSNQRITGTLAFRLTRWYASFSLLLLLVCFLALYFSMGAILDFRIDEDLEEDIEEFAALYQQEGLERVKLEIQRELSTDDEDAIFIRLFDSGGAPLMVSDLRAWRGLGPVALHFDEAVAEGDAVIYSREFPEQESETRIAIGPIGDGLVLEIGESLEDKDEMMAILSSVFVVMFLVVIPLAALLGWLVARRAVAGINRVGATAAAVRAGRLDQRVNICEGDAEIRQLAQAFDSMLDRIQKLVSEMREMTDNIAHDLRSPLARIRAMAEEGLSRHWNREEFENAAADTIQEADRMMRMINATLDVAEAEAGTLKVDVQPVDISELVQDACELFEAVAEDKQIRLTCSLADGCRVNGDRQSLQRMLANLLDNALKYTEPGGEVGIDLECTAAASTIAIADTGPGIADRDLPRIFERFYRCDQARGQEGCGLGLSYARAVARAHGGDIRVSSTPGEGSTFTVTLRDFSH